MSANRKDRSAFEDLIGLRFHDPALLAEALTHRSFVNEYEGEERLRDNERLEFLGDAVLDVIVAELLFRRHPGFSEGRLTQLRAALVKTESLAQLARDCRLGEFLRMGHGEDMTGGRERASLLCRAYEALVGAIYLDRGLEAVRSFVTPALLSLLADVLEHSLHIDARSQLQERVQERLNIVPTYRVTGSEGPEHAKEFQVEVAIGAEIIGRGLGASKRSAAREAARAALQYLEAQDLPGSTPPHDHLDQS